VILIFEGTEKSGKTTLAKAISSKLKIPYYKNSYQKFGLKEVYFILWDLLNQTCFDLVIDRDYPSWYVYSKLRGEKIEGSVFNFIDTIAQSLDTKIIICYRTFYENYTDIVPIELNPKILDLYKEFSKITKCRTLFLDTCVNSFNSHIEEILKFLGEVK